MIIIRLRSMDPPPSAPSARRSSSRSAGAAGGPRTCTPASSRSYRSVKDRRGATDAQAMRVRLAPLCAAAVLALAAAPAQARFGVDVVTTATGHRVAVANGSFEDLRWEAAGRSLLGVRDPEFEGHPFGLYRLAPGRRAARLQRLDDTRAIAPDGSALAWLAYTPKPGGAYVADAIVRTRAGRTLARGFAHAAPDGGVISWSPDSRLVAVTESFDD